MTKEEWQAIRDHDASYDGKFYYTIKRTRKICCPSCSLEKGCTPLNVVIFRTFEEARERGYHACRCCHPERIVCGDPKTELAEEAKEYLKEHYTDKFDLESLADALHINKFYLVRTFRENTGFTLLAYHSSLRCDAAKQLLQKLELSISYIGSVTGFSSASHFSQVFRKMTGKSPREYRREYLNSLDAIAL